MGAPKRIRKKYFTPMHPWQRDRLELETQLVREFGLKNKKEVWKQQTLLKSFIDNFKKPTTTNQALLEQKQLVDRMRSLGLIGATSSGEEILGMSVRDIMERRLQTLVFKKGLARSIKQARQFITHRHVAVNGTIVTAPAYVVSLAEQNTITLVENSPLASLDHPERTTSAQKEKQAIKTPQQETEESSGEQA